MTNATAKTFSCAIVLAFAVGTPNSLHAQLGVGPTTTDLR